MFCFGDGRWIQYSMRLNVDGSWFGYQYYLRIKYSEGETPIPRQTCVFLHKGPVIGINVIFPLGTEK